MHNVETHGISIRKAAQSYLHDAPEHWIAFSDTVASRLATHVAGALLDQLATLYETPVLGSLTDYFLAILLSPANVHVIASAHSKLQCEPRIARCITQLLDDIEVDISDSEAQNHWDDIVDLGESGLVLRWDGRGDDASYMNAAPCMTVRSARGPLQEKWRNHDAVFGCYSPPDDYDPSAEDEAMSRDIDALNDEIVAAGVRIFVGRLSAASRTRWLRAQPDGKVLITDGPYLETKEHTGGLGVLEPANLDDALAWRRKAAVACRAPVEVRQFN